MNKRLTLPPKRSWPLTIVTGALFLAIAIGVYGVLRYVGHEWYLLLTIVLPASLFGIAFGFAALNGRKETVKYVIESVLHALLWMP